MQKIVVTGGAPLHGEIPISGAKNAALPLMIASLLTGETLELRNVPRLADIASLLRRGLAAAGYAADWADFAAWCAAGGVAALPARPVVVAAYLASLARKLGRSGLRRRLAAIAHEHRRLGHPWQSRDPVINATLRGILGQHGAAGQHRQAVGDGRDHAHVVLHHQHRAVGRRSLVVHRDLGRE